MRLVSCYIDNFGKISDFSYDFSDGFNGIMQENGWGKTTFSVFLKAMFYGMEYSPNTKKKLLDRNHYMPWDGGTFGGNLVFEIDGKDYRVERTFGKTDKDDTFGLFEVATGLESSDFTENLGLELFQVDRDSFEKSVYVPQMALATAMTDSLNAKMGNLASAKDDISNFDKALKSVNDAKSEYTRNSKVNPGKLVRVKNELKKRQEDIERLSAVQDSFEAQGALLDAKVRELEEVKAKKAELVERIQLQSKKEQELGIFKTKKEQLEKEQDSLKDLEEFFAAGVISHELLQELTETESALVVDQRTVAEKEVELQRIGEVNTRPFEQGVPTEAEYEEWSKAANRLAELRAKSSHAKLSDEAQAQIDELRFFFSKCMPKEDELAEMEREAARLNQLDGRIYSEKEKLMEKKANASAKKKAGETSISALPVMLLVFLALGLLAIGITFSVFQAGLLSYIIPGSCFAGAFASAGGMLAYVLRRKGTVNRKIEEMESEIETAENQLQISQAQRDELVGKLDEFLSNFLLTRADTRQENVYEIRRKFDKYTHLLGEQDAISQRSAGTLEELTDVQLQLNTTLGRYASSYGINLYSGEDENLELNFISRLKKDADAYLKYQKLKNEISVLNVKIETKAARIDGCLVKYPVTEEDRKNKIVVISKKLSEYEGCCKRIEEAQEALASFSQETGTGEEAVSVEELQVKQNELDQTIIEMNRLIGQDKDNLSTITAEIERLNDVAEEIGRLEILVEEYKKKADLLAMTADYLQAARDNFLAKYMTPLQDGLHKYLDFIEDFETSDYQIADYELDMDLNIKLIHRGHSKSADYLSTGYQDMVALCSRLALLDVLYEKEQPPLILDDPFTNLDEDKIKEALRLLQKISATRQIIYFTCHNSRA